MTPHRLLVALLAFLGLIAVLPMWTSVDMSGLGMESTFLAGLALPAFVALYVAGWAKPSLAGPVLALFVLIGVVVIMPTLFGFVQIGVNETDGLAQTMIQLALPIVIVVFIVTMARERF